MDISDAMCFLHEKVLFRKKHLVHGDLRPSNILLAADGTTKICNFGLRALLFSPNHAKKIFVDSVEVGTFPLLAFTTIIQSSSICHVQSSLANSKLSSPPIHFPLVN